MGTLKFPKVITQGGIDMKKYLVRLIVLSLVFGMLVCSTSFAQEQPSPPQYNSPAEYQKATGREIIEFNEATELAELVKTGKLPPVEERLPEKPLVVVPVEEVGQYGGTWRMAMLGRADTPALNRVVAYEPLLRWSPDFKELLSNIAEKWEIHDDGRTFVFYLRKGIKWSDGTPLTTEDAEFWFKDVILNEELTPVLPKWLVSEGKPAVFTKVDEYIFELTFSQPQGLFLQIIANNPGAFVIPKHYMEQFHPKYTSEEKLEEMVKEEGLESWYQLFANMNDSWMNPERPTICAWKVVNPLGIGTRMSLTRNPYYWKVDIAGNQLPYVDRLAVDIVDNQEVLTMKALAGEIDMQYRFVGGGIAGYPVLMENRDVGNYRVIKAYPVSMNEICILFNLNHKDPILRSIFNDRRFRIAMSHAINRQEIIDLLYLGQAQPYQAAPLPQSRYYYEQLAKAFIEYDPDKANQLLDEMGLTKRDSDGFRLRPDGKTLSITLEIASLPNPWPDAGELIKKYWGEVGVKVAVKIEDRSLWQVRTAAAEHDVTFWFGDGGINALLEPYWYFPYSQNSRYAPLWGQWYATKGESGEEPPEEVKQQMNLYDQILVTPDEKKQEELFRQILDINLENLYVIGVCTRPFAPGVVKNNFHNVPDEILEDSVAAPGQTNTCQYFIR